VALALIGALAIGLSLGLLGSGGSILTVPVLVYLVGRPEKAAIAESLFIVGAIALGATSRAAWRGLVDWRAAALFGLPATVGSYLGAWLSQFVPGFAQLALLGALMLVAALRMAWPLATRDPDGQARLGPLLPAGLGVGVITGLVGVGGGFLIVPALVGLAGLTMHRAVGASLAVISISAIAGGIKSAELLRAGGLGIDWRLVLLFAVVGNLGGFCGGVLRDHVSHGQLKRAFAAVLVILGLYILASNAARL
jgi:uncharacterized protein